MYDKRAAGRNQKEVAIRLEPLTSAPKEAIKVNVPIKVARP